MTGSASGSTTQITVKYDRLTGIATQTPPVPPPIQLPPVAPAPAAEADKMSLAPIPGVGPIGTFSVAAGFGRGKLDALTMIGTTNTIQDTLNGVLAGSAQNTESRETQNDIFDFTMQTTGPAIKAMVGLGEFSVGTNGRASLGAELAVSNVGLELNYLLTRPSDLGRTTMWEASGSAFEGSFTAVFERGPLFLSFSAARVFADISGGTRNPPLGGEGVRVLQDEGRFQADSFSLTGGLGYRSRILTAIAGLRHTSTDVSLEGSGALEATIPQGMARRFTFNNSFEQRSNEFVLGIDLHNFRLKKGPFVRGTGSVGGSGSTWAVHVGYFLGEARLR